MTGHAERSSTGLAAGKTKSEHPYFLDASVTGNVGKG